MSVITCQSADSPPEITLLVNIIESYSRRASKPTFQNTHYPCPIFLQHCTETLKLTH